MNSLLLKGREIGWFKIRPQAAKLLRIGSFRHREPQSIGSLGIDPPSGQMLLRPFRTFDTAHRCTDYEQQGRISLSLYQSTSKEKNEGIAIYAQLLERSDQFSNS